MKPQSARSDSRNPDAPASGCPGAQMMTLGCRAKGSPSSSSSSSGRPMMARSTSPFATIAFTSRRLPSRRWIDTPGRSSRKREIMCGAMYLAVLTSPMVTLPPVTPFSASIRRSALSSAWRISVACSSRSRPASVSTTPRPTRSNSGKPQCPSTCLIWNETAPGVRPNCSATRAKDRLRAAAVKIWSWRSVAWWMVIFTLRVSRDRREIPIHNLLYI